MRTEWYMWGGGGLNCKHVYIVSVLIMALQSPCIYHNHAVGVGVYVCVCEYNMNMLRLISKLS
jgi:hypothetical protein